MYAWLKYAYPKRWASEEQCRRAVELNKINAIQFKEITNLEY
ncbi:XkdX family protein [Fusibacter sp. 3D3]|nr:XkdX family protein [Fusibacter sp. 3D3]GAU79496.1 hypothetical protein F3D3_4160 [Fusibacter sp. 3D3]